MTEFVPTYLYIKQHKITGLKYFGKTSRSKEELLSRYHGSGKPYWYDHLKKHGKKNVTTIWYELFTNKEDLVEFATFFSEEANIINAVDKYGNKIWANLKIENGLAGGSNGPCSMQQRERITQLMKGKNTGPQSTITKQRRSEAMKGKNSGPQDIATCPHCNITGGISNLTRYHFDNCKNKKCI